MSEVEKSNHNGYRNSKDGTKQLRIVWIQITAKVENSEYKIRSHGQKLKDESNKGEYWDITSEDDDESSEDSGDEFEGAESENKNGPIRGLGVKKTTEDPTLCPRVPVSLISTFIPSRTIHYKSQDHNLASPQSDDDKFLSSISDEAITIV